MKKFFYVALLTLFISCDGAGTFHITGQVAGIGTGDSVMLFSYSRARSETPFFASRILPTNDQIDLSGTLSEPQVVMFLRYNLYQHENYGILFLEDGDISVTRESREDRIVFSGTPLNDIFENYNLALADIEAKMVKIQTDTVIPKSHSQKVLGLVQSERASLIRRTIDANLDNLVGAYLFVSEELPKMGVSAANERMSQFSGHIRKYKFMQEANELIEAKLRTEPGGEYVDISLIDNSGKEHRLSDLLSQGNYVLVDFWASRSQIYQREVPYLQAAYAEFKDRGFEIYGVSMDTNRSNWEQMCEQMPWVTVIRSSGSTVTSDYAITNLPTNFLISPEGIIVAKDLRGKQVRQALEEYLK